MKNDEDFFPIKGVRMNYEILFCWNMISLHNQQIHQFYLFESFLRTAQKYEWLKNHAFCQENRIHKELNLVEKLSCF